jgi:hypothetical protein
MQCMHVITCEMNQQSVAFFMFLGHLALVIFFYCSECFVVTMITGQNEYSLWSFSRAVNRFAHC